MFILLQGSKEKLHCEAAVGISGSTQSNQPKEDFEQLLWTVNNSFVCFYKPGNNNKLRLLQTLKYICIEF